MGLIKMFFRSLKNFVGNIFDFITRKDKKKRKKTEEVIVPRSWKETNDPNIGSGSKQKKDLIRIKHKRKIPGLKRINQLIGGFFLLVNFIISQFALASLGSQAQWLFWIFLGNCYFILKYLWGSRRESDAET